MLRQKTIALSILTVLALVVTACAPAGGDPGQPQRTPASPPASGESLAGTHWMLVSFGKPGEETPVREGSNVTVEFQEDGQVGGSGGCNSYSGQYQVEGDSIAFHEIASTLMACADQTVTGQEAQYLQALDTASQFTLADNRLRIFYDSDQNVLNFTPLEASSASTAQPPVITDSNLMPSGPDEKQYTLAAEAGQTIMIEVTSDGVPLSLTITSPSGVERFPEAVPDGSGFRISHSFVASEAGAYHLTLTKADQTPSTNYTATFMVQ